MSREKYDNDLNNEPRRRGSGLRTALSVFLIVLTVFLLGLGWMAYQLFQTTNEAIDNSPLLNPVRSLLLSATPEILPDPLTILTRVNQLARLETASVEAEKIVTSQRDTDMLLGLFGESIVFVAAGEVIAGIDLEKMEPGDIQVVSPTTVMVHLPDAEILVATLDNDKSYVVDRDVGLFTGADPELETQVRQIGEAAILEYAVDEVKIMDVAEQNAQEFMLGFLIELGFENVVFMEDTPPTPVPYEQEIPKGRVLATPES
ncbi:MAG: DUF4230 domain-containing protein [Chloroflexota bacterium]